jgi:hypothetical protein
LERSIPATGSDIVDRGFGEVRDLFSITEPMDNAISNIPYNITAPETVGAEVMAEKIIRHLLPLVRCKMALILPLTFWESVEREAFFLEFPPARCWVCTRRPSMPPGRMDSERDQFNAIIQPESGGGKMPYAWFIWLHGIQGDAISGDCRHRHGADVRPAWALAS